MRISLEDVFREDNESIGAFKLRWQLIEKHISGVITIFDLDLNAVYKSPSIRGFTSKEAKQQALDQMMVLDSATLMRKTLLEELALEANGKVDLQRSRVLEIKAYKKDGSIVPVETHLRFLRDSDGVAIGIIAVSHDITKRKLMEEALLESEKKYRELSTIDDLTQLYNSRHFYNQLKMEIGRVNRYKQPLTLILLDVDNFKSFNDNYGHIEGDKVLMRFGQIVRKCVRETDSAYRYGGEEFTILLPMTTKEEGLVAAERIRTEFKKEIFSPVLGQKVNVTMSIGIAQYKSEEDEKTFVQRADQLMYQAKKNGKDRVCYEGNV